MKHFLTKLTAKCQTLSHEALNAPKEGVLYCTVLYCTVLFTYVYSTLHSMYNVHASEEDASVANCLFTQRHPPPQPYVHQVLNDWELQMAACHVGMWSQVD